MTDLSNTSALSRTTRPLPVSWYFDPAIYALEQAHMFAPGPHYMGHELMVPKLGDYHVLPWTNNAKALIRNARGVELISNVCRHRQALMLSGAGNTQNIVCPLHRWTYNLEGDLLGAPQFAEQPCARLDTTPLQNWNGLLFSGGDLARDFASLKVTDQFDFSGYVFDRATVQDYNFNWKTFIEVYLEDYHVQPYHPGLSNFVDCSQLEWQFDDRHSVQIVGVNNGFAKSGTPVYRRWQDQVLGQAEAPRQGAIWMLYFPNLMLEWYPNVLIVSLLIPQGPEKCTNVVEFYYPEEIALFEREFVEAEQHAYAETAVEDDDICLRMHEGRKALYLQGLEDAGPYQSPLEDGLLHFHEYVRRSLDLAP